MCSLPPLLFPCAHVFDFRVFLPLLFFFFLVRSVTQLRAAHARGETAAGLDVVKGEVGDMWALGIREAYKSKLQVMYTQKTHTPTHRFCCVPVAPLQVRKLAGDELCYC